MSDEELHWWTAERLVAAMRTGELSAREVLDAHLARIDEVNPPINAVVTLAREHAEAMAAAADERQAAGEALGVLHGLPMLHKDLAETAGIRTTHGSPIFADHVPDSDTLIVERAIAAGAVTVGKSNTPEFGAGSQTFNAVFGATANPYALDRTCGGSSGGAAAALAAGMVPIADGSDMGGSLRNPASFCNVVGFRPSPGRVPSWPKATPWNPLATEGPMARTVADVALLLSAQAGPDRRCPTSLETPGAVFGEPLTPPDRLRVAWAPDLGGLPIDPAVTAALANVPNVLDDLGHTVHTAAPDLTGADEVFDTLRAWSFASGLGAMLDEHRDQMKATVQWNVQRGLDLEIGQHMAASVRQAEIFERGRRFFDDYDVLLCPVAQVPPFDLETEYVSSINGVEFSSYIEWMRVCTDITVMHCPAISVPAGFTPEGLPIGLQIVGPMRSDRLVLELAAEFEAATQVGQRRPNL